MARHATLYRMVSPDHLCPFGLKSRFLLKKKGYQIDDHPLRSREETEKFKREHDVETTPQVFIDGSRVGGYDALKRYFGESSGKQEQAVSYWPVAVIFSLAALVAWAVQWRFNTAVISWGWLQMFVATSMIMLALQKLRDVESFANQFITYDLVGMRYPPYANVYPYLEALAGIGMIAHFAPLLVGPIAIVIGAVGGVSVFKAVYIDKRELKCACVGGNSKVPLGFVSLTENIFMFVAGCWMILSALS